MSLSDITEKKPYLKEVVELYGKILEFQELELSNSYAQGEGYPTHYIDDDVELVFNEFSRIFGLPIDDMAPLKDAMARGKVDLLSAYCPPKPEQDGGADGGAAWDDDDMGSVIYILSRPFFKALREAREEDAGEYSFKDGRCPVCSSVPSVSVLEKDSMRQYHCTVCSSIGHYRRIGCPNCQSEHARDLDIIFIEDDKSIRLDICNNCMTYIKSIDSEHLHRATVMEHDIISLPLDVVAQEKGYARRSPNPVGIIRIS